MARELLRRQDKSDEVVARYATLYKGFKKLKLKQINMEKDI